MEKSDPLYCSGLVQWLAVWAPLFPVNNMRMWALWLPPWVTTNLIRVFLWSKRGHRVFGQLSLALGWQRSWPTSGEARVKLSRILPWTWSLQSCRWVRSNQTRTESLRQVPLWPRCPSHSQICATGSPKCHVTLGFPHLHLRTKRLTYILLCVCNLHTFVVALLLTSCLPARALSRNRRASAKGALFTLVSLLITSLGGILCTVSWS